MELSEQELARRIARLLAEDNHELSLDYILLSALLMEMKRQRAEEIVSSNWLSMHRALVDVGLSIDTGSGWWRSRGSSTFDIRVITMRTSTYLLYLYLFTDGRIYCS